jgi:uncharacterized SAM-binding protein YcdF (DUF218 family)
MLKSILLLLVLPPLNLMVLLFAGLLTIRRAPRVALAMVWTAAAGLLLLSMPVVSIALLRTLENGLRTAPDTLNPPQAIVVLGAEVMRTPSDPGGAVAGHLTTDRLRAAAGLQRRTGLPVLVTGGSFDPDVPPVGALMAAALVETFGVPVRWIETNALDTWQNARFSGEILRSAGISSIFLVTHPWHMKRALTAFTPTGLAVTPAPTPLQRPAGSDASDYVPHASAWQASYLAFHEWVGRAWYALR